MTRRRAGAEVALADIDWPRLVAPGSLVVWGQGCAEPTALTASLMEQRGPTGGFRAFVGIGWGDSAIPSNADNVAFASYCGNGRNSRLADKLDILPLPYSALAETLARDRPTLLLSLGKGRDPDTFSFGAAREYLGDLLPHAGCVVAQISDHAPRAAPGDDVIRRDQIDLLVYTNEPPASPPPAPPIGPVEQQIAARVATLIEDRSTLQIGLGAIPAAILEALCSHRDLGLHSGMIGDEVVDLVEQGVITNRRKTIDQGRSVGGVLLGGPRLLDWADANPAVALRPTSYTHDPQVLRSIDRLVALNSAIEVDLTGQVNAEVARGRYVGAVGGAGDFLRGAQQSKGGLPIIALPSRAGDRSRIVASLSGPVSTSRSDVGIIVTEHGIADLRGLGLRARRDAMLAVADPGHLVDLANTP